MARLSSALTAAVAVAAATAAGTPFCGESLNGGPAPMIAYSLVALCADPSDTIASVDVAFYGTPTGACGALVAGTCDAANASAIVAAACVGSNSCTVWPNSTTFGDPCFGTVKRLVVQMRCGSGAGVAQMVTPNTDAPQAYAATVSVGFDAPTGGVVQAVPSLQVVDHHSLMRGSPIHDASFASLAALQPRHARLALWFPYPQIAVAELQPASGAALCTPAATAAAQVDPFTVDCGPSGGVITAVPFASFGTAAGVCGAFSVDPTCYVPTSPAVAESACLGRQSCSLGPADFPGWQAHCPASAAPYFTGQFTCSNASARFTYWNFTLMDDLVLDFWGAVDGDASAPILSLSTAPTWLYDNTSYSYPQDPAAPFYGYNRGTAPARNASALGAYYGRLLAWYMRGGFQDEYGNWHVSGHALNVTIYEVGNEVDYEHGHTPQSYTQDYDAIVRGIRAAVGDNGAGIKFNGMNLPNIDDGPTVVAWANYFLNASNHDPDTRDSLDYIGYHAYPTGAWSFTPDPTTFNGMFEYVDAFVANTIAPVEGVIAALSPSTRTLLDECGTDMDNVLGELDPPYNNPRYWVASGGYFAYLFGRVVSMPNSTVRSVGASQLMDAPGQEPSVTMLSWANGQGTARYWVLQLLINSISEGDVLVQSTSTSDQLYALAFVHANGSGTSNRLLLVNKVNAPVTVTLQVAPSGGGSGTAAASSWSSPSSSSSTCAAQVVDEMTGLGAAYSVDCSAGVLALRPFATAVVAFG